MPSGTRDMQLVIGLTGSFGSGCSTVAGLLQKTGDYHVEALSTPIKEAAKKRGLPLERRALQELGNELREQRGNGFVALQAAKAAKKAAPKKHWVLDGIRNPGEIEVLRSEFPNFYLIAVDASRDIRYARLKSRYARNEAEFDRDDQRDRAEPFPHGQQVAACVDRADVLLINENEFTGKARVRRELESKIDEHVVLMASPGSRLPSPRELLMHLAYSASLRSSCLKRQVGAVIVAPYDSSAIMPPGLVPGSDEFAVVAAGYNEVPRGQDTCRDRYEGQCYRDQKRSERPDAIARLGLRCKCGEPVTTPQCRKCCADLSAVFQPEKALDYCRALHAEETAILQGTRTGGPALSGAVLYTTTFPCLLCAKMIVHAGIKEVVYVEAYPGREATEFLKDAGVSITRFEGVKAQAFYRLFKSTLS